jgi:hypothetical protein
VVSVFKLLLEDTEDAENPGFVAAKGRAVLHTSQFIIHNS